MEKLNRQGVRDLDYVHPLPCRPNKEGASPCTWSRHKWEAVACSRMCNRDDDYGGHCDCPTEMCVRCEARR